MDIRDRIKSKIKEIEHYVYLHYGNSHDKMPLLYWGKISMLRWALEELEKDKN